jgi:hypothetical protein
MDLWYQFQIVKQIAGLPTGKEEFLRTKELQLGKKNSSQTAAYVDSWIEFERQLARYTAKYQITVARRSLERCT